MSMGLPVVVLTPGLMVPPSSMRDGLVRRGIAIITPGVVLSDHNISFKYKARSRFSGRAADACAIPAHLHLTAVFSLVHCSRIVARPPALDVAREQSCEQCSCLVLAALKDELHHNGSVHHMRSYGYLSAHDSLHAVSDEVAALQAEAHAVCSHADGIADTDGVEAVAHQASLLHPSFHICRQIHQVHVAGVALIPHRGDSHLQVVHVQA